MSYVGAIIVVESPQGAAITVTLLYDVTGPGQPRLDSGSFPCQMLYEGFWAATHLPLHIPSSLTPEQHWVTSIVVHVTCVLSWAIRIVTSTVRVNQLLEVCDTLLLTPMENSQSHCEIAKLTCGTVRENTCVRCKNTSNRT